ncbi:MAG TPA: hypothetical protein VG734_04690 [Lacunisphaera sp.]|nr:hypothetical protein [Lacunisphaera sp.]
MRRLLQSIIHNRKLYDRPQDEWTCGRAAEGCPCVFGPDHKGECRATSQCLPAKKGDRWVCTRPISLGGPCAHGPQPEGACGCPVPPCVPVRSLRGYRRQVTWLATCLAAGLVTLALWGWTGPDWISPGPVTASHAMSAQRCADCHVQSGGVAFTAAERTRRTQEHNQLCLKCHDLGNHGRLAHGVTGAQLIAMAQKMPPALTPSPLVQRAARPLAAGHPTELACATCHREHHGREASIRHLSDQQCQVCHQAPFDGFTAGHPEFTSYPASRRTRLQFDHITHWQKHFVDPRWAKIAPTSCAYCHEHAPDGGKMLVKGFEQSCAQCHAGQIEGEGRAGAKGLVFLRLPEIDIAALEAAGRPVGEWPEFCEGEITSFMAWMLEGDATARKAMAALGPARLADLGDATPAQKAAAAEIVWSIKGLMADLITQGQQVMMRRLDAYAGARGSTRHTGNFSADSLEAAQRAWLPGLLAEVAAHRRGEKPAPRPPRSTNAGAGPAAGVAPAPAKPAADPDDLLGDPAPPPKAADDDLLAAEPPAPAPASAATARPEPARPLTLEYDDAEARVAEGGWYRRDETYTLYYRPTGHADEFLTAWLETTARDAQPASQAIYDELASPRAPGVCMKCHTTDRVGNTSVVNWLTSRPQPLNRPFTTFKHAPHFSLMGVQGCLACHVMDPKANYAADFGASRDSTVFHSNFAPITKNSCIACHQPTLAGASCQQCHNYHTGEVRLLHLQAAEVKAGGAAK